MAEREIASIVWEERDDQICVAYVADEPDHMVATQLVAAELARDAGLSLVATPLAPTSEFVSREHCASPQINGLRALPNHRNRVDWPANGSLCLRSNGTVYGYVIVISDEDVPYPYTYRGSG